ncbi:MAG: hypothetical protein ACPHCN_04685 [Mycobacterium sp.]
MTASVILLRYTRTESPARVRRESGESPAKPAEAPSDWQTRRGGQRLVDNRLAMWLDVVTAVGLRWVDIQAKMGRHRERRLRYPAPQYVGWIAGRGLTWQ